MFLPKLSSSLTWSTPAVLCLHLLLSFSPTVQPQPTLKTHLMSPLCIPLLKPYCQDKGKNAFTLSISLFCSFFYHYFCLPPVSELVLLSCLGASLQDISWPEGSSHNSSSVYSLLPFYIAAYVWVTENFEDLPIKSASPCHPCQEHNPFKTLITIALLLFHNFTDM